MKMKLENSELDQNIFSAINNELVIKHQETKNSILHRDIKFSNV